MSRPVDYESWPDPIAAKGPDQNDRNWEALSQPTGRKPFLFASFSISTILFAIVVAIAIIVHVCRLIASD